MDNPNTISFFDKYKKIIFIIILLILCCYIIYLLWMPNRIKFTIRKFEKAYSEYLVKDQIDFCNSKKYKDTVVADFFISSSYNPVAIGYLKYDYVSKNMIETTIVYGARYIELEILDFEIKNKTVPVMYAVLETVRSA